jgi:hypothetical protein
MAVARAFTNDELYQFWKLGDVNQDGVVDQKDLDLIGKNINGYNPACDINEDHVVDTNDLQIAASNFGQNIYDYFDISRPIDPLLVVGGLATIGVVGAIIYWATRRKKGP